ncbi:formyltransferase family protein [Haloarcula litorea]|uniref:formyltransferase family protein n=1 Tax=Haloarcula litorea TaxID=3032579 RepID=UPI0023E7AD9E|nr:formyltransferase family protein [Halomicroarcula sp. GDY20]
MPTVAFVGSRPHGRRCFELLADHPDFDVRTVVAPPPEQPTWWEGSLFERATTLGYDPVEFEGMEAVLETDVDYLLAVGRRPELDPALLDHPAVAPLGIRLSELPRYRGHHPIRHAILNAREDDYWRYGATLHLLTPTIETGDVVARQFVPIEETDTGRRLYERVVDAAVAMFREHLPTLRDGDVHRLATPQSAYGGPRYDTDRDGLDSERAIDPGSLADADERTRLAVYDRVRAFDFPPFPPAYTTLSGRRVQLTVASYAELVGELPVDESTGSVPSRVVER